MAEKYKIGVALVNWNGGDLTTGCISSLFSSSLLPDEIFVFDNGSTDFSIQHIRHRFPQVSIHLSKENIGFTGANNFIIDYFVKKGYDLIWVLNNDTLVEKDCLLRLSEKINVENNVLVTTAKIYFENDRSKLWYAGGRWNKYFSTFSHFGEGEKDTGLYNKETQTPFVSGCCMLVHRNAYDKIGAFDNFFFAYNEDGDWCYRAMQAKIKMLYVPEAVLYHKVSSSMKKLSKNNWKTPPLAQFLHIRNRLYFLKKNVHHPFYKFTSFLYTSYKVAKLTVGLTLFGKFENLTNLYKGLREGIKIKISI